MHDLGRNDLRIEYAKSWRNSYKQKEIFAESHLLRLRLLNFGAECWYDDIHRADNPQGSEAFFTRRKFRKLRPGNIGEK
jgi:hypothetical protein